MRKGCGKMTAQSMKFELVAGEMTQPQLRCTDITGDQILGPKTDAGNQFQGTRHLLGPEGTVLLCTVLLCTDLTEVHTYNITSIVIVSILKWLSRFPQFFSPREIKI